MIIASNARIGLRTWELADAEQAFEFYGDPKVSRLIGDGKPAADVVQVREILAKFITHQNEYRYSPWAVVDAVTERIIGICGIHCYNENQEPELGFRILSNKWGQGIGTETSRLAVTYSFSVLSLESISAITLFENLATQHVLAKIGFVQVRKVSVSGSKLDGIRYELKKQFLPQV